MFDIYNKTEEDIRQERTDKIERFFAMDMCVKKDMHSLVPTDSDLYSMDSMISYMDKLFSGLKDLRIEFELMGKSLDLNKETLNKIDAFFKKIIEEASNLKYDPTSIKKFFNNRISFMREEFVNDVKMNFKGYAFYTPIDSYFDNCVTINEALHLFHSYVMNNDNILQSLNVLDTRDIAGYPLTLYGKNSPETKKIFDFFPSDTGSAYTDLIGLPSVNKTLMMVRDKGHALSIEITYDGDEAVVEYFVPKLCNIDMINALPGVIKVSDDAPVLSGTTGRFIVNKEELPFLLGDFVRKVPTDDDMPDYGYRGSSPSL